MKWEGRKESENVEDRRGLGKKAGLAIGGGGGLILLPGCSALWRRPTAAREPGRAGPWGCRHRPTKWPAGTPPR